MTDAARARDWADEEARKLLNGPYNQAVVAAALRAERIAAEARGRSAGIEEAAKYVGLTLGEVFYEATVETFVESLRALAEDIPREQK